MLGGCLVVFFFSLSLFAKTCWMVWSGTFQPHRTAHPYHGPLLQTKRHLTISPPTNELPQSHISALMNGRRASLPLLHSERIDHQIRQPSSGFSLTPPVPIQQNRPHNMLIEQQHKIAQLEDELRRARKEVNCYLHIFDRARVPLKHTLIRLKN